MTRFFHGDFGAARPARARDRSATPPAERAPPPAPEAAAATVPLRQSRKSVAIKAHLLRGTGDIVDVEIRDLSYYGCKVMSPAYLWQNETMRLSIPHQGTIVADVRWCMDGVAGLEFEPEDTPEKTTVDRVDERIETAGEVRLKRLGSNAFLVDVQDMSRFGCRIQLVERPNVGEIVMLRFDGLDTMEARIAWIDGFTAGAKFNHPIHPAVFKLLTGRLGPR